MKLPPDYHIHTVLCQHAEGALADYRSVAAARGIPEICPADHSPNPDGYDPRHRMPMERFGEYLDMVAPLQDGNEPTVLLGIEADYYRGADRFLRPWLSSHDFDLVIGSVHYLGDWNFDNPDYADRWSTVDVKSAWKEYFALILELADSRMYDVVGHLDLPKKFGHRLSDRDLKEMAQPVLDAIARAGMGIEINTSGLRRPVKEIYPGPLLLELARERGLPICFGSDAHRPSETGFAFETAVQSARECGYRHHVRFRKRQTTSVPLDL
jgi:histidinol-phosphatase (PHP family)